MRRRELLRWIAASGAAGASVHGTRAQVEDSDVPIDAPVDPYFLDAGVLSEAERADLLEVEALQERLLEGQPTVIPRGLKPPRAPSYRLVHWSGEIGDSAGRFVSP